MPRPARVKPTRFADFPELHPWACVAIIAIAVLLLLHQSVLGGKGLVPADGIYAYPPWSAHTTIRPSNIALADQYLEFAPSRQFFHDELMRGNFPLWNPHLACGIPSLASMQGSALYPINLLLSPIAPFTASGLAAFLKLVVAGCFTWLYLRRLGATSAAAVTGGLTFTLSGFVIVWLGHPHTNAAVLLPALFYFLEGGMSQPRTTRSWIGVAIVWAMALLGGHPPTATHMLLAVAAYAGFRLVSRPGADRLKLGLSFGAAILAGALIAAPQLFPFAEYFPLSSSAKSSEALARWNSHLPVGTLIHFLLPYLSGSPVVGFEQLPEVLGQGNLENFNERTGYVGILALGLAVIAIVRRRCRFTVFFAGLAAIALTVIYGVPPWPWVMRTLPVLSSINHERLLLWLDWSCAVLAGLGADALFRARPAERPRAIAVAFALAVTTSVALTWATLDMGKLDAQARAFLTSQLWVPIGGVVVLLLLAARRMPVRAMALICVGWTAVDLLWFGMGFNPAIDRGRYYPATEAVRFLQQDKSAFRVLGASTVLIPNTASVFGLDDVRGQDFMSVARYEELITGKSGNFFFYQTARTLPTSLPMLNAKYILLPAALPSKPDGTELVYDKEIAIYRNARAQKRALVVRDHIVEPNPEALLGHVRAAEFDPARVLWLEEQPPVTAASAPAPTAPAEPGTATITRYESDDVTIEADLAQPGFVLLLDTYYPGWTATLDGQPARILRANYNFRAIAAPAGHHVVTFAYRPVSFRLGLWASGLTLAVLAGLWIRDRRSRRT